MTCGGCARSVTNAIKAKAPDATVVVDLEPGTVTVDGVDDSDLIKEAVEDAGYDYVGEAS